MTIEDDDEEDELPFRDVALDILSRFFEFVATALTVILIGYPSAAFIVLFYLLVTNRLIITNGETVITLWPSTIHASLPVAMAFGASGMGLFATIISAIAVYTAEAPRIWVGETLKQERLIESIVQGTSTIVIVLVTGAEGIVLAYFLDKDKLVVAFGIAGAVIGLVLKTGIIGTAVKAGFGAVIQYFVGKWLKERDKRREGKKSHHSI